MTLRFWSNLADDKGGNVAMLFALALIPILMLSGFAIDSSRHVTAERHLQASLDSAALVGARLLEDASLGDAQVRKGVEDNLKANLRTTHKDQVCKDPTITIDRDLATVRVDGDCVIPTLFGDAFWAPEMRVVNSATARAALTKLDLALMLDVSGSMGGQKLKDLKQAAKDAAATLITPQSGDRVRISFNTYSTSVNAGKYAKKVLQKYKHGDSTCVSERTGSAAWKDDKPGNGKWLGNLASSCPTSSVLPLTNDLSKFNSEIDKLNAGGWTAGHLGVAWAWYLISPDWTSIWTGKSKPLAYNEPNSIKAVILMTDGQFNTAYDPAQGDSNAQAIAMCDEMRTQGVLVYSVAFQAPSSAKATLKTCAGDPKRFFDATDGNQLKAAYKEIASQLSALSLVG